jgi:hypothetical protein
LEKEQVGGSTAGISSWIKKGLGFAAAYIGFSQAINFTKESLKDFDEEAKVRAQLAAGLKSTHNISNQTVEGLTSKALVREDQTLFRHDETERAQSILLAFNKIRGKVFDQAIISAQDLATRFKIELPEATKMMGKALEDPIHGMRMLRMAGIDFSDGQLRAIKKLMAQGDLYKVQLAILKGMNESFGGSAVAAAHAGIGPMQQLTNKFHSLKEEIGERLAPTVNSFSGWFGNLIDKYREFITIPVSQKLEDERLTVNSLVSQLSDHNITAQRRNDIYDHLKTIAPDILTGIDKESISWDKLRKNVSDFNDELKYSIALESQRETIAPYLKKQFEATKVLEGRHEKVSDLFSQAESLSNDPELIRIIANNDKLAEHVKIKLVQEVIQKEEGPNYGKLTDVYNKLSDLNTKQGYIFNTSVKEATDNLNNANAAVDSITNQTTRVLNRMFPEKSDTTKNNTIKPGTAAKKDDTPKIPMGEGDDINPIDKNGNKDKNFIKDPNDPTSGNSRSSGSGGSKSVTINVGGIKQEVHFTPGNYEKKKDEMKQELIGAIVDAASDAGILAGE